jgi:hypothetical protein
MGLKKLLSVLLLLVHLTYASAQEYSYTRYDVKEGLAGSVVYHGVEDKDGFLWFATETGVSRFDGTHFRNFTMADGLPDNEIIKLFVDSKNRVWMMPFRSSICYYWKGKIYNQENDSLLKRLSITGSVVDILEDREGNIVITDILSIFFIMAEQQVKKVKDFAGTHMAPIAMGLNKAGHISILTQLPNNDISILDYDARGTLIRKQAFPYRPIMLHAAYLSGRLQIFRERNKLIFLTDSQPTSKTTDLPASFNSISVIADSLCSINTGNGAIFYDIQAGKISRHVLQGRNINATFRDSEGNSWFLTSGTGIFRVGSFELNNITFLDGPKMDLPVFCLTRIDSLIYAGSERSLVFTITPKHLAVHAHRIEKTSFNIKITSIVEFPRGRIKLGTNNEILDMKQPDLRLRRNLSIKSLFVYRDSLLASIHTGVLLLSENLADKELIWWIRSTCSYVLNDVIYNGTLNGLYRLDSIGKMTWLGDRHVLLRSRVADMKGSKDGILWIATQGTGLVGYKDGKVLYSIRKKDGLSSDNCRKVFISGNDVWVGTDKGINRIQWLHGQYKITPFTSADGLISDVINAIYVDSSQVYAGTPAGLTTFDVDKIALNSSCRLRMTGLQANNNIWAYDTTGFSLPPNNNAIRFDYIGISYRSAGDISYRYRLVGLNDNWQTTRETYLSYPSLPSGDYELQLIATNKFGVESEMVRIPFLVEKRLWEKTWFRLLVLLIVAVLVWIFVASRIRKIRRQNDEKIQINNRMTELEQMALKAQMNPHFIFNSLNSVQQYVIDKDLRGANKFITEFSRLIRLTLDISSKTKISIYEEISYLTTYLELEKTKFEDHFSYSVVLSPGLDPSEWFIPPMILQPYVENCIRHGVRYRKDKLGHIKLLFSLNGQYLICQIEDNGVGRQKAGLYKSEMAIEYQSKGMTLTAKRIEMLNKNQPFPVLINIEDLETNHIPAGTRVTLQFPLSEAGNT